MNGSEVPCTNCVVYASCMASISNSSKSVEDVVRSTSNLYKRCCLIKIYIDKYHTVRLPGVKAINFYYIAKIFLGEDYI